MYIVLAFQCVNFCFMKELINMLLIQNKEFLWKDRRSGFTRVQEPSALEIAAEQMRILPNLDAGNFIYRVTIPSLAALSYFHVCLCEKHCLCQENLSLKGGHWSCSNSHIYHTDCSRYIAQLLLWYIMKGCNKHMVCHCDAVTSEGTDYDYY